MAAERRARRRLAALAVAAGVLVVGDVVASAVLMGEGRLLGRPVPPFPARTNPKLDEWAAEQLALTVDPMSFSGSTRFDTELGWTLARPYEERQGRYRIGPLGTRGPGEYTRAKPDGVVRLVCVGDSFVHCDEVDDQETWPVQLEALEPRVEALNLGVPAYGNDQALLRYRRLGRDLEADVAVMGLLLDDIARNANRYRPLQRLWALSALVKPRFRLDGGALALVPVPPEIGSRLDLARAVDDGRILELVAEHEYWLERPSLGLLRFSATARVLGGWYARRLRAPRTCWADADGEPLLVTLAILERFRDEALAAGARAAPVLIFPAEHTLRVARDEGDDWWRTLVIPALEARGLDVIDACTPLSAAFTANGEGAAVYGWTHLSGVGNAIVATTVRGWLAERGLL